MLAQDIDAALDLRETAHNLAYVLNGYEAGILANDDSAGIVLDRMTTAPDGEVPMWGQSGTFDLPAFNARVETDGIFGIGGSTMSGQGFPFTRWTTPSRSSVSLPPF